MGVNFCKTTFKTLCVRSTHTTRQNNLDSIILPPSPMKRKTAGFGSSKILALILFGGLVVSQPGGVLRFRCSNISNVT